MSDETIVLESRALVAGYTAVTHRAVSKDRGAWGRWYPAMIGAMAGALVAVGIGEMRLEAALKTRPPILVADYEPFVNAVGQGARPEGLKVLADQFTSRAAELGRLGYLVVNREALVGSPKSLALPHDQALLDLSLGLAGPPQGLRGTPSLFAQGAAAALAPPAAPGGQSETASQPFTPNEAAILNGAIQALRQQQQR